MIIHNHLTELLATLGLTSNDLAGNVAVTGKNNSLQSIHRLGEASSIAAAAQAATAAALWKLQTGQSQDVTVNIDDGIHGLHAIDFIKQNGYQIKLHVIKEDITAFYQTQDSKWIFFTGSYPQLRDGLLSILKCENNKQGLTNAVSKWQSKDLEEAVAENNLIGAVARSAHEWHEHPQGQAMSKTPVVEITPINPSPAIKLKSGSRPLSGLKVLDISTGIAGPVISKILAEQGADVLRITSNIRFDHLAMILDSDWGKKSAYLDLNNSDDIARLKELIKQADIFVDSLRPGALAKKGLSPADLSAINPGIIYVSLSCYGFSGPWASRGGFDQQSQCVSGLAVEEGDITQPKLAPTYYVSDYITSYLGAAGALAAVYKRTLSGGSYHVKVSLTRTAMWLQSLGMASKDEIQNYSMTSISPPRLVKMSGAFGELETLAPVAQYSKTPAHWDMPPQPWGASIAKWS